MWLFLLACIVKGPQAKDIQPSKWPQPLPDLPSWVRHPEDWPDPPTIPPPDPKLVKLQTNVKNLLNKVKHASIRRQQWQLAASINVTQPVSKRKGLVLSSTSSSLKQGAGQPGQAPDKHTLLDGLFNSENADYFRKLTETYKTVHPEIAAPSHFHEAQDLLRQVKGFESHLAGLKGNDDAPDEFLWKNLSKFAWDDGFNSTFWKFVCVDEHSHEKIKDDGEHTVGIWKDICETRYSPYHLRFRDTVCSADVKAITMDADFSTEVGCAYKVIRDAECSKVFHFIPDKSTPENSECKCVKKGKVCAPADNDKGGKVFWLE